MIITIVTNPELGWDCVQDVMRGSEEEARKMMLEDGYSEAQLETIVFSERDV